MADSPASGAHGQIEHGSSTEFVDPFDMTSASHSTVAHDGNAGPSNPTLPGQPAGQPSGQPSKDPTKQTFRTDADAALDAELEAALSGTDVDAMVEATSAKAGQANLRGTQAGTVFRVDLSKGELLVDLGGKNQAIVSVHDFDGAPGGVPAEGEFIEIDIEKFDPQEGLYRAHRKGAARKVGGWDEIKAGQVVEATVTGMNKGGLECRVGQTAIRAFMPSGQVDVTFHKDISVFIGQKVSCRVTKVDKADRNLVLSRRAVVEGERREARQQTLATIEEGQILKGTVKTVKDFGAFVDLGGVDGLLHVSQLTHRRMADANEFVKAGEEVEVVVDKFEKGGKGGGKISLSLSHRPPDPWESAESKYPVGASLTGRVTRVENFGCFVEVEDGVEGLLPASEMSWRRIRHPSEVANVGDQLRVMVIQVEPKARKLTLSLKQAAGDPWQEAAAKYTAGSVHKGKVTRTADFGAFVEFEPGVEGLIHISELSNNRVRRTEDVVNNGQEVNARVLEVDSEKRRLRLTLKEHDPEAEAQIQKTTPPVVRRSRPRGKSGFRRSPSRAGSISERVSASQRVTTDGAIRRFFLSHVARRRFTGAQHASFAEDLAMWRVARFRERSTAMSIGFSELLAPTFTAAVVSAAALLGREMLTGRSARAKARSERRQHAEEVNLRGQDMLLKQIESLWRGKRCRQGPRGRMPLALSRARTAYRPARTAMCRAGKPRASPAIATRAADRPVGPFRTCGGGDGAEFLTGIANASIP